MISERTALGGLASTAIHGIQIELILRVRIFDVLREYLSLMMRAVLVWGKMRQVFFEVCW